MVKLIIAGGCGRMGERIISMAQQTPDVSIGAVFERPDHPRVGQETVQGLTLAGALESVLDSGEVLVDFTHHEATMKHLETAAQSGKAAVVGTTGFSPEEMSRIEELSSRMRLLLAPNMSVGVNLMFKVIADMARVLGEDYDIEVVEAHHRMKKDAPSGTAMRMAEILAASRGSRLEKVGVFARHGHIGQRSDSEIGVQTIRAGDIVGDHTVYFAGPGERIEVTHRAHSRDNFARGALKAAQWIVDQPNGLYDMQDVLGLK